MNKFFANVLIASALLAGSALAHAEGTGPRTRLYRLQQEPATLELMLSQECHTSDSGWQKWRDSEIKKLLTLKSRSKKYLDQEDVMLSSKRIADHLDACKAAGKPAPEAITGNLATFVRTQRNANYQADLTHQSGHSVDDHEYLRLATPALELPCLLRSPHFLEQLGKPNTYFEAFKLIQEQNRGNPVAGCTPDGKQWVTLVYRSRFLPTPDYAETFGRFFVRVPGEDYDRWIQFGIWLPEDHKNYEKTIHNVSVVAIAKGDDPRADKRFDALTDWWRIPKDGLFELELKYRRELQPYETDNCLRCHKTVPIGLHPLKVYEFDERSGKLKAKSGADKFQAAAMLNAEIFGNYARPPIYEVSPGDTFALPKNYGPALGPDKDHEAPVRTPSSVRTCTARHRLSPASVQRVIDNMGCAECHNRKGNSFGLLNYPLATEKRTNKLSDGALPNLIRSHILTGVMPLDSDGAPVKLSPSERAALYDCLSQEYFNPATNTGLFVNWLKNKDPALTAASMISLTPAPKTTSGSTALLRTDRAASIPPPGYDQCLKCHKNPAGPRAPSLVGVYMRQLAGDTNFGKYSADLKEAGAKSLVWDENNLMAFLKDPDAFLTDRLGHAAESDMAKRYADESFRRAIVQYLMALK
jgi:cytochrome c